jgi:hypothetical protein
MEVEYCNSQIATCNYGVIYGPISLSKSIKCPFTESELDTLNLSLVALCKAKFSDPIHYNLFSHGG